MYDEKSDGVTAFGFCQLKLVMIETMLSVLYVSLLSIYLNTVPSAGFSRKRTVVSHAHVCPFS